jgi:hypothetical protein
MKLMLVILFGAICTSASAQWYHIGPKLKKKAVRPETEQLSVSSVEKFPPLEKIGHPDIVAVEFGPTNYSYEAAIAMVMKQAQHNMRFRVYNDASYNFSELARLYIQINRLSEAKWYLLQSNNISRQQNDNKHTVANLIDLATIKAALGEIQLAEQDLAEAKDIATTKGLNDYIETIDLAMQYIKQNRLPKQKPALIYADDAQNNSKAE